MIEQSGLEEFLVNLDYRESSAFYHAFISVCGNLGWPTQNIVVSMDRFAAAMGKDLLSAADQRTKSYKVIRSEISKLKEKSTRHRERWPHTCSPLYPISFTGADTSEPSIFFIFDPSLAGLLLDTDLAWKCMRQPESAQAHRSEIRRIVEAYFDCSLPELSRLSRIVEPGIAYIPFRNGLFKRRLPMETLVHQITAICDTRECTPRILGVWGLSGMGKTTLARNICRNKRVLKEFEERVYFLTMGKYTGADAVNRAVNLVQKKLANAIAKSKGSKDEADEIMEKSLWEISQDYPLLLVLDDVYSPAQVEPFRHLGGCCRVLAISKSRYVLENINLPAYVINWPPLDAAQSHSVFAKFAGPISTINHSECQELVECCAGIPLILGIVGRLVRRDPQGLGKIIGYLRSGGFHGIKAYIEGYTNVDPNSEGGKTVLSSTLDALIESFLTTVERKSLQKLAVVPPLASVPRKTLRMFWDTDNLDEVNDLIDSLEDLALIEIHATGAVSLHDLIHVHLRRDKNQMRRLHQELVHSFARACSPIKRTHITKRLRYSWESVPSDGYYFEYLPYHLARAGWHEQLDKLLLDYSWLSAKLKSTDVYCLLEDYRLPAKPHNDIELIRETIRLSISAVNEDASQLGAQLIGRLYTCNSPRIRKLKQETLKDSKAPWLCPVNACLEPPRGRLQASISTSSGYIQHAVVSPDGCYVISVGRICQTWLLDDSRCVAYFAESEEDRTLFACPIPDSELLVTASGHGNISMWNWRTGKFIRCIATGLMPSRGLLVSRDGKRVLYATGVSLQVYDIAKGLMCEELSFSEGILRTELNCITFLADERLIAVGLEDGTTAILNSGSGTVEKTLRRHEDGVCAVVVMPDSADVISVSHDGTGVLWEIRTGLPKRIFYGTAPLTVAATFAEGSLLLTGDSEGYISIWDMKSARLIETFRGHSGWISTITVRSDKGVFVTCGADNLVRVWGLEVAERSSESGDSNLPIVAVATDNDEECAISMSENGQITAWSLSVGTRLSEFGGKSYLDFNGAISRDGRHVAYFEENRDGHCDGIELYNTDEPHAYNYFCLPSHGQSRAGKATYDKPSNCKGCSGTILEKTSYTVEREKLPSRAEFKWFNAVPGTSRTRKMLADLARGKQERNRTPTLAAQCAYMDQRRGGRTISISDNGMRIALNDRGTVRVWDLKSGIELYAKRLGGSAGTISISGSGKWVVKAENDKRAIVRRVWILELERREEYAKEICHSGDIQDIAIDDKRGKVVSVAEDATLKVWDLRSGDICAEFAADGALRCCAVSRDSSTILAGDVFGRLYMLRLVL